LSGRNLDAVLKTAGISKYRLAKDLGISYRITQYWAKGRRPSPPMAERVAAYLGIQVTPVDDHAAILRRLERIEKRLRIKKEES
ncbi:MAG: helix-turn-helix domain-containing protein, partial [Candidatus Aminicenantes bacterium]|nr:helix-turn-helix domain-containing protein [Candidatus Aminicenantes bacterium]